MTSDDIPEMQYRRKNKVKATKFHECAVVYFASLSAFSSITSITAGVFSISSIAVTSSQFSMGFSEITRDSQSEFLFK